MEALIFFGVILGIIWLIIWFVIATEFAAIASEKGYDDSKYLWYTFLLGIAGMLLVIALPDRTNDCDIVEETVDKEDCFEELPLNKYDMVDNNEIEASYDRKNVNDEDDVTVKAIIIDGQKICPICGKTQNADRTRCWECGKVFE